MDWPFPTTAVEQMPQPAILVDPEGRIRVWNRAATAYFGDGGRRPLGAPCWTVSRFHQAAGEPWCSSDCPIQQQARENGLPSCFRLFRENDGGRDREFDLFTALVPPRRNGRIGVLHLVSPAEGGTVLASASVGEGAPRRRRPAARRSRRAAGTGLDRLSPREREVLRLLASGLDTWALATRLGISPTTVRNHVQSILRALGVHSRLDAVLLWMKENR